MKKLIILLIILLLSGCDIEEFCGTSSYSTCSAENDCIEAGCSSQICQSKTEEPVFTTCEYRDCYNPELYNLECKCIENKCQWHLE